VDTTAPTVTAVKTTGVITFVLDLGIATVTDLVDIGLVALHDALAGFPMGALNYGDIILNYLAVDVLGGSLGRLSYVL